MDVEDKIQNIVASNERILDFSKFCSKSHIAIGCKNKNCDIKMFTSTLSTILDMSNKADIGRKQYLSLIVELFGLYF